MEIYEDPGKTMFHYIFWYYVEMIIMMMLFLYHRLHKQHVEKFISELKEDEDSTIKAMGELKKAEDRFVSKDY